MTVFGAYNSCVQIDTNHFLNCYQGDGYDGYAVVLEVDTSTWAVTTANSKFEFDTQNNKHNSCVQIDTNHFLNCYSGLGADGYAVVLEVNTTTWAITTASTKFEFDTEDCLYNSCVQVDTNHFINCYQRAGANGNAIVLEVNTTTWAITTASNLFVFDTQTTGRYQSCIKIDTNHFLNCYEGVDEDGYAVVLEVNTNTWEITTKSILFEFDTQKGFYNSCVQVDTNHFLNCYQGVDQDGYSIVLEVSS